MCFDSLCGDMCINAYLISAYFCILLFHQKHFLFGYCKQSLCVRFSAFVYKFPITILRRTSRLGRLHLQSRWNWSVLEKKERHLSGTFIIPKSHGTASIFDEAGRLYAHPSWASRGLRLRCWQIYLLRQMYFTLPHPPAFQLFHGFTFLFSAFWRLAPGLPWILTRAGIYLWGNYICWVRGYWGQWHDINDMKIQ